jgi:hypothetical protein
MSETPKCACGCGGQVSEGRHGWNHFIHGHHRRGVLVSEDVKQKIGQKNSINMRRYMRDHPQIVQQRVEQMQIARTSESEARRLETMQRTYDAMTDDDKQKFRDRTKHRWASGELAQAHLKAVETFRQRSEAGMYDFETRNENLSRSITRKYLEGGFEWSRGTYLSTKTGRECYYRSSWELILMRELDNDPDVLDWESEFTSLPYQFEEAIHHYVPDFHVVRSCCHQLVEVKPQSLRLLGRNIAKRLAAQTYCEQYGWQYIEWKPAV